MSWVRFMADADSLYAFDIPNSDKLIAFFFIFRETTPVTGQASPGSTLVSALSTHGLKKPCVLTQPILQLSPTTSAAVMVAGAEVEVGVIPPLRLLPLTACLRVENVLVTRSAARGQAARLQNPVFVSK